MPLPVRGSLPVTALVAVVTGSEDVLPCGTIGVVVVGAAVVGGDFTVVGDTTMVVVSVVGGAAVVVVGASVVGGAAVVVVGASVVVVSPFATGSVLVLGAGAIVVVVEGVQSLRVCNDDDCVKSTLLSGLRMVNVTVPAAGAFPLALQINCVPELLIVS